MALREFSLLARIYRHNAGLSERVSIPPGDDLAQIRLDGKQLLVGVDQVVDGRHFVLGRTPVDRIGYKAIARSVSDIAAMAGMPVASLGAAVLPTDFPEESAADLFEAMRAAAAHFGAPLIGGDVAIGEGPMVLSVTVLAEPTERGAIRRSGGRPGDVVWVTGRLGGAWRDPADGRHLCFEPRVDLALQLVRRVDVHAMVDLSDGLGRDLDHIAEMSGVSAVIDASRLPLSQGCDWKAALTDGEDYELCFTTAIDADVPDEIDGVPITRVGRLRERRADGPRTVAMVDGVPLDAASMGWEHRA